MGLFLPHGEAQNVRLIVCKSIRNLILGTLEYDLIFCDEAVNATDFGAGLTEAEVDYLVSREWARTAEDILWRRSKLGLRFSAEQAAALAAYLAEK